METKVAGLFIVMGVSGCGKSEVARKLAATTKGAWLDGDDFHPAENKAKMSAGIPLTDNDRWPWLDLLNQELRQWNGNEKGPLFLACSALKERYRQRLAQGLPELRFVYLKGPIEVIRSRMSVREGHFMPVSLLESQVATLEEPKEAIVLDIRKTLVEMVEEFLEKAQAVERS